MSENLDFDTEEFFKLPKEGRIELCLRMAERAQRLAKAAEPGHRASYLDIAKHWLALAKDMSESGWHHY